MRRPELPEGRLRCARLMAGAVIAAMSLAGHAQAPTGMEKIEVFATPLPDIGAPLRQVPANVQVSTGQDLRRRRNLDLTEFLDQNAGSVTVNPAQSNPFQPDLAFRGFLASPLLGTPQGLSVFLDGVRINEPFGDVVNWDLVPKPALAGIQLNPGSNPLFGLNTLGGALVLRTKDGFSHPGATVSLDSGSWGRRSVEWEAGASGESVDVFAAATSFEETGWREHSPSRVNQLFAKAGWRGDGSRLEASVVAARTSLQGTQALPRSLLDNPRQAYTWPDITQNELVFAYATASHHFTGEWLLGASVYGRHLDSTFFNSNVNDDYLADIEEGGAPTNAFNDRGRTRQRGTGASLQLTYLGKVAGKPNRITLGGALDQAGIDFKQETQPARFGELRETAAAGEFAPQTDVRIRSSNASAYFFDVFEVHPQWSLSLSGRFNRTRVRIEDQSGAAPALNGAHVFSRFNPAIGLNFNPPGSQTWFASYGEGIRAPSPVELTCADPQAPCRLPNNFLADPPLAPVVSRTLEAGGRGRIAGLGWSAALFRTDLRDDIQFIAAGGGSPNAGYFQNVGSTRRQGVELGFNGRRAGGSWALRSGFVDATFRSGFVQYSPDHSEAGADGRVEVRANARIPGVPRHSAKLRLQYERGAGSVGANWVAQSGQYARGDESNRDRNGAIPGFAALHLDAALELGSGWTISARINNVFDRRYQAFGTLGRNFFATPGGDFDASSAVSEQFRSSAAPRGVWIGVRWEIGTPGAP